jgi:hypothetical protein
MVYDDKTLMLMTVIMAYGTVGASCSTLAPPMEHVPPVCEFCDVGEQELNPGAPMTRVISRDSLGRDRFTGPTSHKRVEFLRAVPVPW